MSDGWTAAAVFVLGLGLALVYYGGFRWTVRRLESVRRPAMLLAVSTAVRLAIVIGVLAMLVADEWRHFFIALVGFLAGRFALERYFGRHDSADRDRQPVDEAASDADAPNC